MKGPINYICAIVCFIVLIVEFAKGRDVDFELLFLWITIWGSVILGKINNMD